jgi:RNA polymerase sigma-70 factor (ECF subfamily)
MAEELPFEELMRRLRAGDQEAATLVFNRFTQRLIALARSRLDQRMRQKLDPEDVVNSAYKSFFVRNREGKFHLESWDSLWGMLTVITVRKCGRAIDRFHTQKQDVEREVAPPREGDGLIYEALASDPTPSEAALLAETVENLLRGLPEVEQTILALTLQGYSIAEIKAQVGRTERTVQRVLERVRKRLQRLRGDGEAPGRSNP